VKRIQVAEGIFKIAGVLPAAERVNLAARADSRGFEEAAITRSAKRSSEPMSSLSSLLGVTSVAADGETESAARGTWIAQSSARGGTAQRKAAEPPSQTARVNELEATA
jgi:hypothetical protein